MLNGYNISMLIYIYIYIVSEIENLETDVKDCNEKCQRVNCNAIYDAIMSSLKLLYDLIFMCCAEKKNEQ